MGLEVATFIDGLVIGNPVGSTDAISEGDNHLRLIKTVLKNSFPGLAGIGFRVQDKATAYTVVATDNTTILRCTATLTLTLTAASTLGNGRLFYVLNDSRGLITIDPNAGETINGQRVAYVLPDQLAIVFCNGSAFFTLEDTQTQNNPIYNSGMEIWQQWGLVSATVSSGQRVYGPDGFQMAASGISSQIVMFKGTDVPTVGASQLFVNNSLQVQNKVAKGAQSLGQFTQIEHIIEGYNFQHIAQRPFWFSFYCRSSQTGTYNVSFRNGGRDRSFVDWFTINAANTWEYKSFLIDASPALGTWNYTQGTGLIVTLMLGGSATQVTRQSWTAVEASVTTANVNWNVAISASFGFAAPQINLGSRPGLWQNMGLNYELNRAKRYYHRSRSIDYGPMDQSATDGYVVMAPEPLGSGGDNAYIGLPVTFPVTMRVKPVVSLFGAIGLGAQGSINFDNTTVLTATVSAQHMSTNQFSVIRNISPNAVTAGRSFFINFVCDARL